MLFKILNYIILFLSLFSLLKKWHYMRYFYVISKRTKDKKIFKKIKSVINKTKLEDL